MGRQRPDAGQDEVMCACTRRGAQLLQPCNRVARTDHLLNKR